jgi:dCMP deaminase
MKNISNIWKNRYLSLAKEISTWSKDPSTQVGSVAIGNQGQVLSQGYNGFPRKFPDKLALYEDREQKYKYTIHAEMNCIYHATLNGISLEGSTIFIYGLHACHECAKGLCQVGVKAVIAQKSDKSNQRWQDSCNLADEIFSQQGVYYEKI